MNLDLLDESYPMVNSKLPFEEFDQGGLTGLAKPAKFGCQHMPPLFYGKACVLENIHNVKNNLKTMINNTSPM
jgi:hypothetical protein